MQQKASRSTTPGPVDVNKSPYAQLRVLPFGAVHLSGGFWERYQRLNRTVGLRHGYTMLEQAGNFHNVKLAAGTAQGEYHGPMFMDSDVTKWLEAAAYELAGSPDKELARMVDQTIDLLAAAQADDGYLNSYWQLAGVERRWSDIDHGHELYCAGHLFQAAVAHHRMTGQHRLLDVAYRLADHIDSVFGPGKRAAAPGHPEIETALVELYRATGRQRYLDLAGFFVDQRGRNVLGLQRFSPAYHQDRVPVREATVAEGHAVRQLYLLAGVVDLYLETGEQALIDACYRLWDDITKTKLYITGGLGSRHEGESFGGAYELPNDTAYAETCAAIASIFWNWRMLLATGHGRYADLIERTLYNGFLSGLSLDGHRYFYVNPLLSHGGVERPEWYGCACCPPNVMRLIASLAHYIATSSGTGIEIHQYAPALIQVDLDQDRQVRLRMETKYPWYGSVQLVVEQTPEQPWPLRLRLPAWCSEASISIGGNRSSVRADEKGYITIERRWRASESLELHLEMVPRFVEANSRVDATAGCVAIERGPLVYCLEQRDQEPTAHVLEVAVDTGAPLMADWQEDLLGGVMAIQLSGDAPPSRRWQEQLYQPAENLRVPLFLKAVPYYAWANRDAGPMRVWIPRTETATGASFN